ncbi:MAG: hypothetical protein HY685_01330, partial [Chloroflexi bacterium]|nr:hypothetical protein [Chloroflexota bacterium]
EVYRGGEKPMDFAYLNAVTRSTFMPPYDPWFAGGFLNYYYFGQFMVAVLIRLTGIVPEVSFNLAVPLFFALSVGGAFSVSYNLAEAARRALPRPSPAWGPVLAGIGGAALMGVLGNLGGLVQLGRSAQRALTPAWEAVQVSPERLGQVLERVPQTFSQATLGHENYWDPSRMIPQSSPDIPTPITEFPFFTFLFADLHAHLLALPLTILAIGLALAAAFALGRRLGFSHLVGPVLGLGLGVGALRATNAWDFPTYLVLGAAAVAVARLARRDNPLGVLVWSGGTLAAVYLLSGVLWGPYLETNVAFYTKLVPSPEQTPLVSFLGIYALPVFLLVSVLALGLRLAIAVPILSRLAPAMGLVPEAVAVGERPSRDAVALLGLLAGVAALTFLGYATVALCLVLLTGVAGLVLFREAPLHHRFALLLAGTALALVAFVDFVAIDDHLVRMNTVFKLYLQAWVLLALVGGYFLWWLGHQGAFSRLRQISWKPLWAAGLVLLVLAAAVYPLLAIRARVADRFAPLPLTLDGMAYMDTAVYSDDGAPYWQDVGPFPLAWDKGGIQWLRGNVDGSPVVLEASIPEYRWGSRVSVYTGLPTVIGWNWHQRQQKGVDVNDWAVWRRQGDVQALYDSTSIERARELLSQYSVEYIYVGPVERAYYSPEGLAKFQRMVGSDLALVYAEPGEEPQVTIYQVVRPS